ncbi:hypothetical protein DCCM_0157 [Desulfocucumis palustris]|uniref:DUF3795 domain-containing protein n=1 Tax=Desulfocucumis palustris TaxID=1898651 RepID=A0A2L2X713_9FIRM|nr:DUF3795 domain-containing protein [Desulfocucumis palustris]GBF31967.1 hypothetical protein DCCM_0157 [Desulfocucumis palustris]
MAIREEILTSLAPCGLDCSRCHGFAGGEIKKLSEQLIEALGDFQSVADKLSSFMPVMQNYRQFREMLDFFTLAGCAGCRSGKAQFPLCAAKSCFKEKGVDFCFQCDEYPCGRNRYDAPLHERWRRINDRMKEVGVEVYYEEQKKRPRY